ncbi:META domain-containing protein [Candidatus Nomurabacteria bacterium]|nr:META domain-containing protein [Candidatus Nomurabacteria bacterium]
MKKTPVIVTVLTLLIIGLLFIQSRHDATKATRPIVAVFTDQQTQQVATVSFDNTTQTATLDGAGYQGLVFTQDISASGARYINNENNLVLWNKGNDITLYDSTGKSLFNGTSAAADTTGTSTVKALSESVWVWQSTVLANGDTIAPREAGAFALTFGTDGRISGTTDCNSFSGSYSIGEGQSLAFGTFAATKMFCMNSQEEVFTQDVSRSVGYSFSDADSLVLVLGGDAGVMTFAKR